jgi:hypothetical protein
VVVAVVVVMFVDCTLSRKACTALQLLGMPDMKGSPLLVTLKAATL